MEKEIEVVAIAKNTRRYSPPCRSKTAKKVRARKIVKSIVEGKPLSQIGLEIGLSPLTASSQMSRLVKSDDVKASFHQILNAQGLTDEKISAKISALLDAKSKHFFNVDSEIVEKESEAHETQRKTVELLCRLKGHLKEQATTDISVGLMSVVVNTLNVPAEG